ncbi:hypothetical protein FGIG_01413 [Fasciola gigantica]|uniref:Uncharacterized protein n=1 Tax=Fasciola gigantica TaxID=46835 RepID=A0A504YZC8_FASGI|nr:hypothetical protein FGIG_01413 [Fasciola gigantica]
MLTLKDHLSVVDGDDKVKALERRSKIIIASKNQQNEYFLKTERERAKLYSNIVNNVTSKVFMEKLPTSGIASGFEAPESCNSGPETARTMFNLLEQSDENTSFTKGKDRSFEGRLLVQVEPKFYSFKGSPSYSGWKGIDGCHSPRGSANNTGSSAPTESQTVIDDDKLAQQARQLRLYSYPYLIQSTKSWAEKEAEKTANRVRQLRRRQNFAKAERQRVRLAREFVEDSLKSRKIKEDVEKQLRKNREKSADHVMPTKKTNSLDGVTEVATVEISNAATTSQGMAMASGDNCDQLTDTSSDSSGEEYDSSSSSAPSLDENLQSAWNGVVSQLNGRVPRLCLCAPSFGWTVQRPPWSSCAHNCPFYRRPHAYIKALFDYVRSVQGN